MSEHGRSTSLVPPGELVLSGKADRAPPLGVIGAVVLSLVAVDVGFAIIPWISAPLTVVESLLVLPWARLVLVRERGERRISTALGRLRQRTAHLLNIALLAWAMVEKWIVLSDALVAHEVEPYVPGYRSYAVVALVAATVGVLGRGRRAQRFLAEAADHPARLMILSFGIAAFVGGFLLSLPLAVQHVRDASLLDGLFTATSAVCVTGLAVNDISSTYTFFGQIVILVLAQIGGLGIMVLSASFAVLAGRSLRVKQSAVLVEMIDAASIAALRRTLISIVAYTFLFEAIGASLLYVFSAFYPEVELGAENDHPIAGAGSRAWWSIFHAVSAFCNAGFSLSHGNLGGFSHSWSICFTIMALIVVGGIGFPVIDEVRQRLVDIWQRRRPRRLSLHARVVFAMSAGLIAVVALMLLILEWSASFSELPIADRFLAAVFQAVTLRTAGFNTVDIGAMRPATLLLSCAIMFVGASPGSTGGGVKTTTIAAMWAIFRGETLGEPARLFDRELAEGTMRRAQGVVTLSVMIIMGLTLALLLSETHEPLQCIYEILSAFTTCGLSTGITSSLSPLGKIIVMVAMFVGRIGPLTLAVAMATQAKRPPVRLARERVMIG